MGTTQARSQDFSRGRGWGEWGGAHLKNRDQIINVGMAGRASAEDTKVSMGLGGLLPRKNFEI